MFERYILYGADGKLKASITDLMKRKIDFVIDANRE